MAQRILPENAAVLYLRMSSAKQDKSIPAQRDELLRLAQRKGYTVRREYVDPAVSGDDTEKRTGFLRLREDCENGPDFSIILCWHEDRFSRNDPLEYGYWLRPIRASGVVLETPTGRVDWESLGGRLLSLIGQEMRHDYLRQLSRNVARGHLAAARHGRGVGGRAPTGYKVVNETAVVVRRRRLSDGGYLRSISLWEPDSERLPIHSIGKGSRVLAERNGRSMPFDTFSRMRSTSALISGASETPDAITRLETARSFSTKDGRQTSRDTDRLSG